MKKIKDFFATPKKAIVTSVCLVGGIGALAAGSVAVTASVAKNNSIGNIAAEDIALKDAGIDYSQARMHRTEFDYDNGQYLYEVEFSSNGVEYDYRIKASDGTILWRESEPMEGYAASVNGNQTQPAAQPSAEQQQAQETLAQAQETLAQAQQQQQEAQAAAQQAQEAQKQAQEAAAAAQQQQQQAQQQQQQAEEAKKQAEAAQKQAQAAAAQPQQPAAQPQQPAAQPQQPAAQPQQPAQNTSYISVDQAKNIALGKAGLSASSVNFVKTKLENDDGRTEYEIEFYSGTTEYDYTIDAVTGNVLEYDVDSIYD